LYQLFTLILALAVIGISFLLNPSGFKSFFLFCQINAEIKPVKYLGIRPYPQDNWSHLGRNFLIIISLVTMLVIYFQFIHGTDIPPYFAAFIPWISLLSLTNSFVEEMIFRFSLLSTLSSTIKHDYISIISGLIFGIAH